MRKYPLAALFNLSLILVACGGEGEKSSTDAPPVKTIDAPKAAIDAPPPNGADPAMMEVDCAGANAVANIEYYSCAFFIGDIAEAKVGQILNFIGCDGHNVTSAGGKILTSRFVPTCYKLTGVGQLTYSCAQHPDRKGTVKVVL
jgi:hypothetical protein